MKDSSNGMGKIRKRARRGVSLIEVLVVLVLLVLGILIIVRLYPSGFFSITSVGNAALADSLGQAAVQTQAQNTAGLPDSILPVNSATKDLSPASAADASYDSDDPTLLDNARVINNETITVPAASGTTRQSVYIVNYGPIVMPVLLNDVKLPKYLSINSALWTAVSGTVRRETPLLLSRRANFPHAKSGSWWIWRASRSRSLMPPTQIAYRNLRHPLGRTRPLPTHRRWW